MPMNNAGISHVSPRRLPVPLAGGLSSSRYRAVFQWTGAAIAAALAAGIAALVVWASHSGFRHNGFLLLYIPVVGVAAYLGGRGPGFVTAAVSLLAGWYFISPPAYSFAVHSDALPILLLVAAAGVLSAESAVRVREAEAADWALALIVESSDDAIFSKSLDGTILTWNAGAERLYGYAAAEMIGRPVSVLAPPDRVDEIPNILLRLRRGERVDHYESVRVRKDGMRVDVALTISPVRDRLGKIIGAATIARDITERKRAEQALRRRKEEDELINVIATKIAGETQLDRLLAAALAQVQQRVAFVGGSIALIEGEDLIVQAAVGPFAAAALGQRVRRGQGRVWRVAETETPCLCNDLLQEGLKPTTPIRSYLAVPLVWHARVLGVLEVDCPDVGVFGQADLELLQRVAAVVSGSVEVARLYEAERTAREEAERAAERTARLQEMTAALSGALTPAAVAEVIIDQGHVALKAQAGSLALLTDDAMWLELVRAVGYPQEFVERWRRTPVSTRVIAEAAVRTRQPIFLESRDALVACYGDVHVPVPVLPDSGARAVVPLTTGREVIGVLSFVFPSPKSFAADERAFIQTIAGQCAQALERARLYERERRVAATLQRALLPADLPQQPGVEIHAAYLPGAPESDVGGDWYDAFCLPDGRIAVSVGDVVGRGLNAAVVMGQLRQTIRAAALQGHSPTTVLAQAGKILGWTSGGEGMATALFGIVDPEERVFTYGVAGHPLPVVATVAGEAHLVESAGSLPLGVAGGKPPPLQSVSLPPGTLLVLYTDGLIELTRDVAAGEAALVAAVAAERSEPSDDAAQGIVARVLQGRQASDDIAAVTLSVSAAPALKLDLILPAEPRAVRAVRQAFNRLAAAQKIGPATAAAFEVALGEAVNNVVEHAYGAVQGDVHVRAWREGRSLVAEIEDHGQWRQESRARRGGYGLRIMRALLDSAEVTPTSSGTVVRLVTLAPDRSGDTSPQA
jgi:PAS domain S-box-containing protein